MLNDDLSAIECCGETRYRPCLALEDKKIPYVIWFEDVLVQYGVPTTVFDLYILVPDIDIAADHLIAGGWDVDTQKQHRIGNAEVGEIPQRRLICPESYTRVVLLSDVDWKFPLTAGAPLERLPVSNDSPHQTVVYSSLPGLLDALIESWLDGPSSNDGLLLHLACQYAYLYDYAPALRDLSLIHI